MKNKIIPVLNLLIIIVSCSTIVTVNDVKQIGLPIRMSFIEAGNFQMGHNKGFLEERPAHSVTLTKNYFMAKFETTNKQLSEVLNWGFKAGKISIEKGVVINTEGKKKILLDIFDEDNNINFNGKNFIIKTGMDNYPCTEISWYGAVVFCNLLSEMENKDIAYNLNDWSCDFNANGYRLPTEAEWEFACKGGRKSNNYFFAGSNDPYSVAWFNKNAEGKLHPVGLKNPNELGLYDMSGNVWEWCNDYFNRMFYYFSPYIDPKGPENGINRSIRGGAYQFNAFTCRSSARFLNSDPSGTGSFGGFRVVQTVNFDIAKK
jgi:formylglycine-generating enzyme required for sulfatase activity